MTVRIRDLGRRIELVNDTDQDVVVLGYQSEPYLRVGPAGVFENGRSPSLYQNRVTTGAASTLTSSRSQSSSPHARSCGFVAARSVSAKTPSSR